MKSLVEVTQNGTVVESCMINKIDHLQTAWFRRSVLRNAFPHRSSSVATENCQHFPILTCLARVIFLQESLIAHSGRLSRAPTPNCRMIPRIPGFPSRFCSRQQLACVAKTGLSTSPRTSAALPQSRGRSAIASSLVKIPTGRQYIPTTCYRSRMATRSKACVP